MRLGFRDAASLGVGSNSTQDEILGLEFLHFSEVRYREIRAIYDAFDTRNVCFVSRHDFSLAGLSWKCFSTERKILSWFSPKENHSSRPL